MIKAIIFDWGDTLMRDFPYDGPMVDWPRVEAIPGAKQTLKCLYKRFVCAVGSNAGFSDGELMAQALDRVGMRRFLQHFFTSKELGREKPDPEFFRETLRRMEMLPQECIMVGNSYEKDIAPAKAVGIRTVWLSEDGVKGDHPCADVIIRSMCELEAALP
jgi:FMN phosphatase YigB (HAD superfamily)